MTGVEARLVAELRQQAAEHRAAGRTCTADTIDEMAAGFAQNFGGDGMSQAKERAQ